jgi:hypothetical protein
MSYHWIQEQDSEFDMKYIKGNFYLDGGSFVVETDEGTYYQDNAIGSKNKGAWYKGAFDQGKPENEITNLDLIEQLETLKWHHRT